MPSSTRVTLPVLLLGVMLLCGGCATVRASPEWVARLPSGEQWKEHLRRELLPFWLMPSALGTPVVGAFPSVRCNDGSLLDRANPCPEIRGNAWLMEDRTYVVALSRQTYAYGVAFHLTGEPRYLELARAGVEYLRRNAFDREHGGAYAWRDNTTGTWGPDVSQRNPQELSYALLGPAFYYYLTRDEDVLRDLLAQKEYLFRTYGPVSTGPLKRTPGAQGPGRFMDSLDPLNAFMVLLTPLLPGEHRRAWEEDMVALSQQLIDAFLLPGEVLFLHAVLPPGERRLGRAESDFGHTIKALWMLRMVGLLADAPGLVRFGEEHGPRVLERAFLPQTGSWGFGVRPDGTVDPVKDWFVFAELDQVAGSLALVEPSAGRYLPQTQAYWLRHFVDPVHGEVWTRLDGATHQPLTEMPKQWPWKNAYHSFEHALVGYITALQLHGEPVVLHYAFPPGEAAPLAVRPYFYSGEVRRVEALASQVYRVTFGRVR